MNTRITRLEEWSRLSEDRFGRIEDKLDRVLERLGTMPTRADLTTWTLTGVAIAFAVVALIVGGVVGGLDWIKIH